MKTSKILIKQILFIILGLVVISGCDREETLQPTTIFEGEAESTDPLDIFLKQEFRDPYGCDVIYKFVDRYIDPTKSAVPPRRDVVQPIAELIKQAWIEPYNKASDQGEDFLKKYFPAEIVLIGSPLFNGDGTITLGVADAGVRVTLTQANEYAPGNTAWIVQTFRTLHHEFAHIVDQNFNFDVESFFKISSDDYTSQGTWTSETQESAIIRGMVTPYGTSAVGEDFAEIIARIVTTDPAEFADTYLTPIDCSAAGAPANCAEINTGKARIQQKYDAVVKYMKEDVGIDLLTVRDEFLNSIN
ncbi:substrate import-associated zinc metallohydrolase lipoprotein [Aquimarina megaterium]|uniref:substrate import-associated zinc metallohydrolase lipoprotein n=1 Tax=Aquimarina megaterium TaxID=1443666 RepID=UPI000472747F|nr:substrate import-associated zinc metallohydrolase lipoprotein [Aquimarina megaterium]